MNPADSSQDDEPADVYVARWEKSFNKIRTPFEEFFHRQTTSSYLLIGTAVIALILANGPLHAAYEHIIHTDIAFSVGDWGMKMSLHHWINDGLMSLFFFVVGLELKREILVGELAKLRNAALPIGAAIGGMVVPALIYYAINPEGAAARGWGIPMATDIAFAVGALALLSSRIPRSLITFLVALAIVDDLGAVIVIALFYTKSIALMPLTFAGVFFLILLLLNFSGVRKTMPYFIVATFLWYAMLQSGIHATLAGILGALAVPATPRYKPERFSEHVRGLMIRFEDSYDAGNSILTNDKLRAVVQTLQNGVLSVQAPLQRLEHIWHKPVAYLVIPIFALVNAGVAVDFSTLDKTFTHPVMLGVSAGLIFGKFIGITGVSWLMLKFGIASLPKETKFSQIAGVSLLAGIGFTMSIFVAQLGFEGQANLLMAKTGILAASCVAGVAGYCWLYIVSDKKVV